jgi:CHAT domain-containing protein
VILSACNTAGGEAKSVQALSGLAKAFFYAGARSMLVSHWYVDSQATVMLITKAFDELKWDPKIGRARALRQAMLSLIKSKQRTWHPAYWAPFVVVGEGSAPDGVATLSAISLILAIEQRAKSLKYHD